MLIRPSTGVTSVQQYPRYSALSRGFAHTWRSKWGSAGVVSEKGVNAVGLRWQQMAGIGDEHDCRVWSMLFQPLLRVDRV